MSLEFAKQLRKAMTPWEIRLWGRLRRGGTGARFHRQEPVGKYIVDFICRPAWLIVEADGALHDFKPSDKERDDYLRSQGFEIMRFRNHEIQWNLNEVGNSIALMVQDRISKFEKSASRQNYFKPKP